MNNLRRLDGVKSALGFALRHPDYRDRCVVLLGGHRAKKSFLYATSPLCTRVSLDLPSLGWPDPAFGNTYFLGTYDSTYRPHDVDLSTTRPGLTDTSRNRL